MRDENDMSVNKKKKEKWEKRKEKLRLKNDYEWWQADVMNSLMRQIEALHLSTRALASQNDLHNWIFYLNDLSNLNHISEISESVYQEHQMHSIMQEEREECDEYHDEYEEDQNHSVQQSELNVEYQEYHEQLTDDAYEICFYCRQSDHLWSNCSDLHQNKEQELCHMNYQTNQLHAERYDDDREEIQWESSVLNWDTIQKLKKSQLNSWKFSLNSAHEKNYQAAVNMIHMSMIDSYNEADTDIEVSEKDERASERYHVYVSFLTS